MSRMSSRVSPSRSLRRARSTSWFGCRPSRASGTTSNRQSCWTSLATDVQPDLPERGSACLPEELEFQLLDAIRALVLDVERRRGRDAQPLARYLDRECSAVLDRVGESAELGSSLGARVAAREIAVLFPSHGLGFVPVQ